jgi:hypothetical protein
VGRSVTEGTVFCHISLIENCARSQRQALHEPTEIY